MVLFDYKEGIAFRQSVTFHYGSGETRVVDVEQGAALVDSPPVSPWVGITLSGVGETGRMRFDVPPATRVQRVEMSVLSLYRQPFETLRLRIDEGDLIPIWDGEEERGRYSRQ